VVRQNQEEEKNSSEFFDFWIIQQAPEEEGNSSEFFWMKKGRVILSGR
jgi:hypothetical protein